MSDMWRNFDNYSCDNQMSIFDFIREPISITKPIRLIELFAGYGSQAMVLKRIGAHKDNMCIVAMRGRNPDNPSDRTAGSPTEQRLEINMQDTSNCLTSVQKDNLVMESQVLTPKRTEYGKQIRKAYESGEIQESRHNMTELEPRQDNVSNTLTTVQKDNLLLEKPQYRIRKLTPRECGRLMGVSDEDIDKMAAVNSNTQLYKQFGNSIVVDVMCAMFKNLNIK